MSTLAPTSAPAPTLPVNPTAVPRPTSTTSPNPTLVPEAAESSTESYRALVRQVFTAVGDLTGILSDVAIQLSGRPEAAPQTAEIVNTTKGTFEFVRDQLTLASPPPDHQGFHQKLLDALEFYAEASAALLPDAETQVADYWRFQGLMQEGGKNFHGAGAEFDKLRP